MFRLHCTTTGSDTLTSLSSVHKIVNTPDGPVAFVRCTCGATVTLESGVQTCHGIPKAIRVA